MKICTKCHQIKPMDAFSPTGISKDGKRSHCKSCRNEESARWRQANPEKRREQFRKWCIANPEKVREQSRNWAEANREKVREISRRWTAKNPEKSRQLKQKWEKANPDKVREKVNNRRCRLKNAPGKITSSEWENLKKKTNFTCLRCRRQEPEIKLTLDHIVPVALGGENKIENAQPLCLSCNDRKGTKTIDYRDHNTLQFS